MEHWDGLVLDINATCADISQKCMQLLCMHALSGCDTTSFPYGKGKVTALNTIAIATIGDDGTTHTELIHAAMPLIVALYSQPPETSMASTYYNIFKKKKRNP